jgi:hypothetical protein
MAKRRLPPLPPLWLGKIRRFIKNEVYGAHAYLPGRRCDGCHELKTLSGLELLIEKYKGDTPAVTLWQTAYIFLIGEDCGQTEPTLDFIRDKVEELS